MFAWALIFFVAATVAAAFGFGIAAGAVVTNIAQILFFVFLVLFVVCCTVGVNNSDRY